VKGLRKRERERAFFVFRNLAWVDSMVGEVQEREELKF